jgi:hypothetical protein
MRGQEHRHDDHSEDDEDASEYDYDRSSDNEDGGYYRFVNTAYTRSVCKDACVPCIT